MTLVGASEAAAILGVEVQRVARYRAQGRMPTPVAMLASTPVWRRSDVEAMRAGRTCPPPKPMRLVGTSEVAAMLLVHKPQVARWVRSGKLPPPLVRLAAGPVWHESQILGARLR